METSHLTEEQLAVYAEALHSKNLDAVDQVIKDHVKVCNDCAQEALFLSEILDQESDENKVVQSDFRPKRNKALMYSGIAAGIAIVFSIPFMVKTLQKPMPQVAQQSNDTIPVHEKDTSLKQLQKVDKKVEFAHEEKTPKNKIKQNPPSEIIAKNLQLAYVPDEQLEKLAERFENSALRDSGVKVLSHSIVEGKANKLILKWDNSDKELLIIELFNNKGERIKEIESNDSSYKIENTTQPGLYYWKLINEDFDLLFCGKIIVK